MGRVQYDNSNDVSSRLSGTVIRYRERPIYIESVEGYELFCRDILADKNFSCDVNKDLNLDFRSPALGYVNTGRGCFYYSRIPTRGYKQGLEPRGTSMLYSTGENRGARDLTSKAVARCIVGDYPSFKDALEAAKKGRYLAFDRNYCVGPSREKVGEIHLYGPSFEVMGSFLKKGKLKPESFYNNPSTEMILDGLGVSFEKGSL